MPRSLATSLRHPFCDREKEKENPRLQQPKTKTCNMLLAVFKRGRSKQDKSFKQRRLKSNDDRSHVAGIPSKYIFIDNEEEKGRFSVDRRSCTAGGRVPPRRDIRVFVANFFR